MEIIKTENQLQKKQIALTKILKEMKRVLVAFSGGVDSTFLLKAAQQTLGEQVWAVTADSCVRHRDEISRARAFTQTYGIKHIRFQSSELKIKEVALNVSNRCYYCKKYLFKELLKIAQKHQIPYVIDGSNLDDDQAYRPGKKALEELQIRSPLKESGLKKSEIRRLSKEMGLPTWDEPTQSCLLTRFPYNTPITEEDLRWVAKAESFLKSLGFKKNRVRISNSRDARIEVEPDRIPELSHGRNMELIIKKFKILGFHHISIDLEGYRMGSMDEGLELNGKNPD